MVNFELILYSILNFLKKLFFPCFLTLKIILLENLSLNIFIIVIIPTNLIYL